jgi:hypothetical protein
VLECLQDHAKGVEKDPAYRTVLHSFAALHFAALLNSCYIAGTFDLHPLALTGELICALQNQGLIAPADSSGCCG